MYFLSFKRKNSIKNHKIFEAAPYDTNLLFPPITDNDPVEQEKRLKYLDLVASAVILQNTVDMTRVIHSLSAEGFKINRRMLATMSPYINCNLKRYGDYVVDLKNIPQPFEGAINLPVEIFETQTE